MRALKVDFSKRNDKDLVPLNSDSVLQGDYDGLQVNESVLLWDDDMEVVGKVYRSGSYKNAGSWVRPNWETVVFRSSGQTGPRSDP